jgi:hypothetical protein
MIQPLQKAIHFLNRLANRRTVSSQRHWSQPPETKYQHDAQASEFESKLLTRLRFELV